MAPSPRRKSRREATRGVPPRAPSSPQTHPPDPKPILGWREWIDLPDLHIRQIKAKIDTGARSSALHTVDLEQFETKGETWVRFVVHPVQNDDGPSVEAEAKLLEHRMVRSSNGETSERPVIVTTLTWQDHSWPIELTLVNRADMRFRMLLGREALRGRFLIDPGQSFCGGEPNNEQ